MRHYIILLTHQPIKVPKECCRKVWDILPMGAIEIGYFFLFHRKSYCFHVRGSSIWFEVPDTFGALYGYERKLAEIKKVG